MLENYCDLQAFCPTPKIKTIEREIAVYRSCVYRGTSDAIIEDTNVMKTLFLEYMLKAFVCYKCIGTRNLDLIRGYVDMDDSKAKALKIGLEMRYDDIKNGEIGVYPFKIDKKLEKQGVFKIDSVGRKMTFCTLGNVVRVMPVFQLVKTVRTMLIGEGMIASGYVQAVYLKDDMSVRSIVSTGNTTKLNNLYGDTNIAAELAMGCKISWERGYIQVPDVERPINDYGCRAINIGRLIRIHKLPNYKGSPYLRVDLGAVIETFKSYIMTFATERDKLYMVGVHLGIEAFNEPENIPTAAIALEYIQKWVTLKQMQDEKRLQIWLHNYMLQNPTMFEMYTGIIR